jgi:hypothetical protein
MKRFIISVLLALVAMAVLIPEVYAAPREEIKLTTIIPDQHVLRVRKGIISTTHYRQADFADNLIPDKSLIVDEGNIGIGTTLPHTKTGEVGFLDAKDVWLRDANGGSGAWASQSGGGGWTTIGTNIYNSNAGNVGVGTTNPVYKLQVDGGFAAKYKNFEIPHPQYPDSKLLVHGSLEGPEHAVSYRGEAQLIDGRIEINLPDYFESLTRKESRTVQLTPVGGYSPLYVEGNIKDGKFAVSTAKDGNADQKFYWEVKAVRSDIPQLQAVKEKNRTK